MRSVKSNERMVEDFEEERRIKANAEGFAEWYDFVQEFHERTRKMIDLEREVEELKRRLKGHKEECPLHACPLIMDALKDKM